MRWWDKWVGLPFRPDARGPREFDCWGLVRAVYAEERQIELPSYGEISARNLLAVARAMQAACGGSDRWLKVADPAAFDVAGMRLPGSSRVGHVGVMISSTAFLHVEQASASVVVDRHHFSVASRVAGFWRFQAV